MHMVSKFASTPSFKRSLLAMAATFCASGAFSAAVAPAEWDAMLAEVKKKGAASVVAHVMPVSLDELGKEASKAKVAVVTSRLLAELGNTAREAGRWDNQGGQMALRLTEAGLKILRNSGNAIHFYPGRDWIAASGLSDSDGSLTAIEQQLQSKGSANVQVTLNVDGLDYELDAPGKSSSASGYRAWAGATSSAQAVASQALNLLGKLKESEASDKAAAVQKFQSLAAQTARASKDLEVEFSLRLTREGLEKLSESKDVRGLRLVGYKDPRPARFDDEALAHAEKYGFAPVIISVRNPMAAGFPSKASVESAIGANKRTLNGVLAHAGILAHGVQEFARFAAMSIRLSAAQLRGLKTSGDTRLLQVQLNKPLGNAQLFTSTQTANFPVAWNAGYRGAAIPSIPQSVTQNIVVMDSGVRADHRFLRNAAGSSKITFRACFGTNETIGTTVWTSNCVNQVGTTGDSPLDNLLDYSAPNDAHCQFKFDKRDCQHGTHVAGIAAGRTTTPFSPLFQGVANQANIIAIQVMSYDQAGIQRPRTFPTDILAATEAVVANVVTPGATSWPYSINLSFGSEGINAAECGNASIPLRDAIQTLYNTGIPVIAATGNGSSRAGVSLPACMPRVIKVAALHNDAQGTTIASFSNLGKPSNFPGDPFFLAPGGGGGTNIVSAISGGIDTDTTGIDGTSQATPHVTGLYALIKSVMPQWTIAEMSAWINSSASQPLQPVCIAASAPCPAANQVIFRRIRLPGSL